MDVATIYQLIMVPLVVAFNDTYAKCGDKVVWSNGTCPEEQQVKNETQYYIQLTIDILWIIDILLYLLSKEYYDSWAWGSFDRRIKTW